MNRHEQSACFELVVLCLLKHLLSHSVKLLVPPVGVRMVLENLINKFSIHDFVQVLLEYDKFIRTGSTLTSGAPTDLDLFRIVISEECLNHM
jgi:hypothetical protein